MTKIGGWYVSEADTQAEFAKLVADIVSKKLKKNYSNIVPEVVGGWNISIQDQTIQRAEKIADAVVAVVEEA